MVGNNFKLTKNNNEFRIDFSQLLYELVKLDNYIEKRWHLLFYSSNIIKNNVKTIVLPENTKNIQQSGGSNGAYYNIVNTMLEGGNDNSALERFEIRIEPLGDNNASE